ncbi:glutathione S-transferase family protein [Limnobacter humi]|uniref:Glutathione S-transferase family protein n=1 Tax=Limnobacter humi TaxID=1778671 RepID=A0ABT1WID3_9BURK|nr:glutathione S-transferase family protein [Limnobacter humi]MCQ8896169.1 glutathione S-transferase family protein [Limnobacter humi]
MRRQYTLFGWHLSYFTGKALCYLRYKQVDFRLKPVNLLTLTWTIKKKTGAAVMPVLRSPQGEWIQDTSVIIDRIEALIPDNPVIPATPVQAFASRMLEAWGDEWWVPIAMHTRWNYPENYALFEHDAGKALLPWAPTFLQKKAAAKPARFLRSMLPYVGIVPEQYDRMNRWTVKMLDALDAHFSATPFLLGERPSLGDFSLVGTMYGHLGRDPWPKRELIEPRKHLSAWLERMKNPAPHSTGALLPNDGIPRTLDPVFYSVFHEFVPMVEAVAENTARYAAKHGLNQKLPRRVGQVTTTMAGEPFTRGALPYMVWMLQRALDTYHAMNAADQANVRQWLSGYGAAHVLELDLPRVNRVALNVSVEKLPSNFLEQAA